MTTVQDLGRAGFQNLGIGISGALDPTALRVANLLVGNEPGTGGLEVLYLGPTIEIEADSVRMSFVGAAATVEILPDASASSGTRIGTMRSVLVKRGEVVRIGSLTGGATLYVGIEGGFDIAADPGQRLDQYSGWNRRMAGPCHDGGRSAAAVPDAGFGSG